MTNEFTIARYNKIRKQLLTTYSTGKLIKHPWFYAGLDNDEKFEITDASIKQVGLLYDMYNNNEAVHITWGRATALVKNTLFYTLRSRLELIPFPTTQDKFDILYNLFRVQLGEEDDWFTRRLEEVSDYIIKNYDEGDDIFKKFIKRGDKWYQKKNVRKTELVSPLRTRWVKGTKEERFNILDELMSSTDNAYVNEYMFLEHMVDWYKNFKHPYAEMMLAFSECKNAPYSKRTAYNYLKEFFLNGFRLYGIKVDADAKVRDIKTALDEYAGYDMLLKERKRGYSVSYPKGDRSLYNSNKQ